MSEWMIECPTCGILIVIQRDDPVLCPECESPDIETSNIDQPK